MKTSYDPETVKCGCRSSGTVDEHLQQKYPKYDLIVTRCHAISTEEEFVTNRAGGLRARDPDDRTPVFAADAGMDGTLDLMMTASVIPRSHARKTIIPSRTSDKRLKLIELSMAYQVLQGSGIIEAPFSNREGHNQFVSQFRSYERGDEFSETEMNEFRNNMRALRNATLALSDAIM